MARHRGVDAGSGVLMVSVIVCTYNPRPDYLERCVEAILPQVREHVDREFFIVDNASQTPVADLPIVRRHGIRLVSEPRSGLTAARECAARTAAYDLLVFVDDDNVLAPGYLDVALQLFQNDRIGALSGAVEPEYEVIPPAWFGRFEESIAVRRLPTDRLYVTSIPEYSRYFPIGAGCCVRRDLLRLYFARLQEADRIEGRRGEMLSAGEDNDIALFAIAEGYLVGCCGRLRVTHLISRRRTRPEYLIALNRGALESAFRVNAKWQPKFGSNVFSFCGGSRLSILLRTVVYGLLSVVASYRVRFRGQLDLLRLRR